MADEKTNGEDCTGNSAFAIQIDEDVGFLSMQNEMAGFVGIAADNTYDRSSSNPGLTANFSGFANNVNGFSNLAHNVGRSSTSTRHVGVNSGMVKNANEFFVPPQSMHGRTLSNNNVHFVQGFGENRGAGFQVVDSNRFPGARFQAYQNSQDGIFPERKGPEMPGQQFPSYLNRPIQTAEDVSFLERKRLQFPGQLMPIARGSGPAQASNVPMGPSYMRYTTRFGPIAHPIQCMTRSKKPFTHQSTSESAQAAPSLTSESKIYPVALPSQAATSLSLIPGSEAFLQPASHGTAPPSQAQTAHPSFPSKEISSLRVSKGKSKIIVPTRPPGEGKPVERGSGLAQASNASVRPSLKRGATQPPSIPRPCQRRHTIHSSVPASAQTAAPLKYRSHNAPVPPQALTTASFPSFPRTGDYSRTLSQSHTLPYPLRTVRPYSQIGREIPCIRVSQDSNGFPQPIGYRCFLCHLDLAFTPEGLILQPGIRPDTAVLPCGHHFHDYCLQQITPSDQTEDPPCIECQKREIEKENTECIILD